MVFWLVHHLLYQELAPYQGEDRLQPDDSLIGFTPDQLNQFYDDLDTQGCTKYVRVCIWYLIPFVETVGFAVAMILVERGQSAGIGNHPQQLGVLIPLLFVCCGVIDKGVQMSGCLAYPARLTNATIRCASCCLIGQWILLVAFFATFVWWGCKLRCTQESMQRQEADRNDGDETWQLANNGPTLDYNSTSMDA